MFLCTKVGLCEDGLHLSAAGNQCDSLLYAIECWSKSASVLRSLFSDLRAIQGLSVLYEDSQ